MNIESLLQKSALFRELVIDSGLLRDLQDYQTTLSQSQNRNLIFMNNINDKISLKLKDVYNSSLVNDLEILIKNGKPFTYKDYIGEFDGLKNNTSILSTKYYEEIIALIQALLNSISRNNTEITKLVQVIKNYSFSSEDVNVSDDYYPICLKFNDEETTQGLKTFHKSLRIWNIALLNYQTLVSSDSPEQIKVQSVNDGCIELVVEYAWDVAEKFAGVIDTISSYYATFLIAKNSLGKLFGDKSILSDKIVKRNEETIKIMFEEMEDNLKGFIAEQVKDAEDKSLRKAGDGSDVQKIEIITKTVIDHFLKGNEVKFLMPFYDYDLEEEEIKDLPLDVTKSIRGNTVKAKTEFEKLDLKEKTKLLNKYSLGDFEDLEEGIKKN